MPVPKAVTLGVVVFAALVVLPIRCVAAADGERIIKHMAEALPQPTPLSVPSPAKPGPGLGIDLGTITWTESNLGILQQANMADVRRLLSGIPDDNQGIMPPENVSEFSWADLEGNGKYGLVMVQMPAVCHICKTNVLILQQGASGKINAQALPGAAPLSRVIRDLNGDGHKELLIPPPVDPAFAGYAVVPHVYRLENGKYVEASREFASYYDTEILPPIDKAIAQARFRLEHGPIGGKPTEDWLRYMRNSTARLTMQRDEILRMTGRDPDAGLEQAREWMNSPDAARVQDAITVFKKIGGHESDVRAAIDKLREEGCDVNGFGPSALRGDKVESDWRVYTSAKNGLSFRYPPSMRVEERDPAAFHLDAESIVDVVGPGGILRFICAPGAKTPEMAEATLRRYRSQANESERPCTSMQIDGHEAFVGGPLNGPWSVNILQPHACDIFPMAGGWDNAPPPHDAKLPLLSIIRMVHFESARNPP